MPRTGWRTAGPAWALWALTLLGLGATLWLDVLLRQAGYPELAQLVATGDVTTAVAAVGAVSLLLRFRRARGLERLQLRWLALGAALAAMAFLVSMAALVIEESDGWVFQAALGISVAVLPLATGAAILRYRLYDLDRIVSRTLA